MITSQYFNITSNASVFASNRHIANKQHCSVWVKSLSNVWTQIPYNDYDLVNNSIILNDTLLTTIYSQVELRVADSQEELGTPVTDISTTASIRDEVIIVADNISDITTVSNSIVDLNSIADNIVKAGAVADNMNSVVVVADDLTNINIVASNKTNIDIAASNITEIQNASSNANTATTKALEASASATSAYNSSVSATNSSTNASNSEIKASKWADNNYNVEVETGKYSAKHWAIVSQNSIGVKAVENISSLKDFNINEANQIEVLGYCTKGDGGGGLFYWDSTSTEADNGGTIIQATGVVTGRWKRVISRAVNVKWFGAKGDGITDDWSSVKNAINFIAGTNIALDLGSKTYLIDSAETPLSWEVLSPCFRLPNQKINIIGDGYILQTGSNVTGLAMFQTTQNSTANIRITGGNIKGVGNNGGSSYALIDGIVLNKGTQNVYIDMYNIDNTKRHGVFIVDGASKNSVYVKKISNTNREMSGCGVQIEGSSDNLVVVDEMYNIGSNGLDINEFSANGYYPIAGGYSALSSSSYNKVFIKKIENTGVNNNAGGSWNGDDDYYGVNVIGATTNNNYIKVGEIKGVRTSNGSISPALSTYAAAIRLYNSYKNTIVVDNISIVGVSDSGFIAKLDGASYNTIVVNSCSFFEKAIFPIETPNTQGNNIKINGISGYVDVNSILGFDFKYLQQATHTTSLDGVISGFTGSWGLTYSNFTNGINITVDGSTYQKITKNIKFTYDYVILEFDYNVPNSSEGVIIGLDETPYNYIEPIKDGIWHTTSLVIPYTDAETLIKFSPNDSNTSHVGSTMAIRNLKLKTPEGTYITSAFDGVLNRSPTVGTYSVGDRVKNINPTVGQPKSWVKTSSSWVSEGNL